MTDILLVLSTFVYVGIIFFVVKFLKNKGYISKFIARKIIHLTAGLSVLVMPFFSWPFWGSIISFLIMITMYFSRKRSKIGVLKDSYEMISEQAEERVGFLEGPFHYALAIFILVTLFSFLAPHRLYLPIAGILIMIVSDTLAAIIGKKFGGKLKITLPITHTTRSLAGSLTFFVSAFILAFTSFWLLGAGYIGSQDSISSNLIFPFSIITAFVATVVELLSPSTWDDLTVPIASTLIVYFLLF